MNRNEMIKSLRHTPTDTGASMFDELPVQEDYEYRIRYKLLGGHMHCRVFSRKRGKVTWQNCGDLVLHAREWISFTKAWNNADLIPE